MLLISLSGPLLKRGSAMNDKKEKSARRASNANMEPRKTSRPVFIVGVGASAGGLEAFTQLLHALPDQPGCAIVPLR